LTSLATLTRTSPNPQVSFLSSTSQHMMQNPSVFLYGPGNAKIEDRPVPTFQNDHDVIVRISYVGVCGSDVRRSPTVIHKFTDASYRYIFGNMVALAQRLTQSTLL
jgi:hypothetical protein